MKKVLTTLVALASMAAASAASAQIGCYVGVAGGLSNWDSKTDISTPMAPVGIGFDNLGATGKFVSLGGGCDARMDKLVLGVFADWDKYNEMANAINISAGGFNAGTKMSFDSSWTIGGRLGYAVGTGTLVYGLLGYTTVSTSDLVLSSNIPGISAMAPNSDLSGWTLGGGIETALGRGFALKLEYRYTALDTKSLPMNFNGIGNVANVGLDSDMNSVRLGLTYHFGGAPERAADTLK